MNVNSRGHNLDTRFEQLFLEIKHPPGQKTRWVPFLESINTSQTDLRGLVTTDCLPFLNKLDEGIFFYNESRNPVDPIDSSLHGRRCPCHLPSTRGTCRAL